MISCSSSTASSAPATSRNVIFGESTDIRLARDLPNDITFEPPPWTWFMRKIQNPMKIRNGSTYVSSDRITLDRARLDVEGRDVAGLLGGLELVDQHVAVGLREADLVLLVVRQHDLDRVVLRLERDRLDRALLLDLGQELAERLRIGPVGSRDQPRREERQDDHDDDRESSALEETAHGRTRCRSEEETAGQVDQGYQWSERRTRQPVWFGYLWIS